MPHWTQEQLVTTLTYWAGILPGLDRYAGSNNGERIIQFCQASVERRGRQRWSKETEETAKDDDHREMCFSSGLGEDDSFQAKRRQAGALLKDLDKSLGQLENMVENKRKH